MSGKGEEFDKQHSDSKKRVEKRPGGRPPLLPDPGNTGGGRRPGKPDSGNPRGQGQR